VNPKEAFVSVTVKGIILPNEIGYEFRGENASRAVR
jgi:hypothetical protein